MRWRWTRIEGEWLAEWLELLARPWPESAGLGWLRHAVDHTERGQAYWVPSWVPGQVLAAAQAGVSPGRRALASVTGWTEKRARLVLEGGAWVDQISTRAKGPGASANAAVEAGHEASGKERATGTGPGHVESSALARAAGATRREQMQESSGAGPGRASFSALDAHQRAQVGSAAAALGAADPAPASSTQGPSKGPGCSEEGPSKGPGKAANEALFRGSGAQQGPGLTRQRAQQGPDRARDLRAGPPSPDPLAPTPGDPPLFLSPRGEAEQAVEGGARAGGGGAGPPPARADGGRAAALSVVARARAYQPDLPDRPDRALLRLVREHPAEDLVLVLDWAARSPDPEARRIREARRSGVLGSWGPGYALAEDWLLHRIARANAWAGAGRPHAADAQLPAEELASRAAAERARALAEDARSWPGWSPPESWQGLPRDYVRLHTEAMEAVRVSQSDAPGLARAGLAWLEEFVAAGWVKGHPAPPRRGDG